MTRIGDTHISANLAEIQIKIISLHPVLELCRIGKMIVIDLWKK